jgi:hypothetical protein
VGAQVYGNSSAWSPAWAPALAGARTAAIHLSQDWAAATEGVFRAVSDAGVVATWRATTTPLTKQVCASVRGTRASPI